MQLLKLVVIATTLMCGLQAHANLYCSITRQTSGGTFDMVIYEGDFDGDTALVISTDKTYVFTVEEWRSSGGDLKALDGNKMVVFRKDGEVLSIHLGSYIASDSNGGLGEFDVESSSQAAEQAALALVSYRDGLTIACSQK